MKHLKLFEEMKIDREDFPLSGGHDISPREYKILTDLVGEFFLEKITIIVEDHYYYTIFGGFYNRFDDFNELKDYLLSKFYIDNNNPEEYLELLKTSKLDRSFDRNRSIWWACKKGHIEIVKYLLNDPRVDPSFSNNLPIRDSSYNGHKEVVKLLLKDKRVDPSVNDNSSIKWASTQGHKEIVRMLLNDERVRSKLSLEEINKYTKYTNETS